MKVEFKKGGSRLNRSNALRTRRDNRRQGERRSSFQGGRRRENLNNLNDNGTRRRLRIRKPQGSGRGGRNIGRGRTNNGRRGNNRNFNN